MYQPGWPMLRLCEEALKSRTMTLKWQGHLKRGNCPEITTLFLVFVFFKLQYFCLFFCPGLTVPRHPLLSTKENYFFCSNLPDPARPVSSLVEAVLCLIWLAGLCTLLSSYLLFISICIYIFPPGPICVSKCTYIQLIRLLQPPLGVLLSNLITILLSFPGQWPPVNWSSHQPQYCIVPL